MIRLNLYQFLEMEIYHTIETYDNKNINKLLIE